MTLGEIIKKYRHDHSLSMDAFAAMSGLSKSYISILEKNSIQKQESLLFLRSRLFVRLPLVYTWILMTYLSK